MLGSAHASGSAHAKRLAGGALLIAGTTSDAGKTVVVAGLCRWLARKGLRVAPFKAQNMSLNSVVAADGAEIGRAQAMQAAAAGVEPEAAMNPVLLKPTAERSVQVIVMGRAQREEGEAAAEPPTVGGERIGEAAAEPPTVGGERIGEAPAVGGERIGEAALRTVVLDALADLRNRYDVVVCEGAGSPAEINLRRHDLANMGLARSAGLPTLVVGDIDRGGVFAALYGTLALLEPADQALIAGFIINKFRGDNAILEPGLRQIEALTGRAVYGVLPWVRGLRLDAEDSLALASRTDRAAQPPRGRDRLAVAVAHLPHMSNFTDLDALACEPGVTVHFTDDPSDIERADLAVVPGTKATVDDLAFAHRYGIAAALHARAERGDPILGVCGGYQLLGTTITDEVECRAGCVDGLGLLPVDTVFATEKLLGRPTGISPFFDGVMAGGYEIRHGRVTARGGEPLLRTAGGEDEGCVAGAVIGTSWHGVLEHDELRRALLAWVAGRRGLDFVPGSVTFAAVREARLDALGDLVGDHLDASAVEALLHDGVPARLPLIRPNEPRR